MASTYTTPGVYINEVSTLPASVAQVSTAVPAFVGYTEFAIDSNGNDIPATVATRITSMVEFEKYFGRSSNPMRNVTDDPIQLPKIILDDDNGHIVKSVEIAMKYILYQSMNMYFANGGAACYVVSVGDYDYDRTEATIVNEITAGFDVVAREDEPTLLLAPDAGNLTLPIPLGTILQQAMLKQCNKLQDRFCIFDLIEDAGTDDLGEGDFRDNIGTQYLKYGAAYGPHLKSTLSYDLGYHDLNLVDTSGAAIDPVIFTSPSAVDYFAVQADIALIQAQIDADYLAAFDAASPNPATDMAELALKIEQIDAMAMAARSLVASGLQNADIIAKAVTFVENGSVLASNVQSTYLYAGAFPNGTFPPADNLDPLNYVDYNFPGLPALTPTELELAYDPLATLESEDAESSTPFFRNLLEQSLAMYDELLAYAEAILPLVEQAFENSEPIYLGIKNAIAEKGLVVPPSGAVAGAYVATDSNRGVWKAPANVSLNNVVGPTIKVDNAAQDGLNVDPTSGKSINVIRSFTGKGVLIWGARTLAGNDNEWRYVPVRRLFISIEESIKKATEFVVFEPNDRNTWVRTRAMIDNYLTGLWRQGALAGAKPEEAFFVNVGLGTTMTAQDILEGRMIVEIGLAAVRPAEFIILRFSHKLQES